MRVVFGFQNALEAFLRRPYWSRGWIIQETSVPSELIVQNGSSHVPWATISPVLNMIEFRQMMSSIHSIRAFREAFQSSAPLTLLKVLFNSRDFLATDPRDMIYAPIYLAHDGTKLVPLPNYYQNVQEVFRELAISILFKAKHLDIISLRQSDGIELENLPSWVPNWSRLKSAYRPWQKGPLSNKMCHFTDCETDNSPHHYLFSR
jgi:hypothetical protein